MLDAFAEMSAATASRIPAIERPAIAAARALGTSPAAAGFRRRFFGRYAARLAAERRAIRPIDVCGHRLQMDVSRPFAFPRYFEGRLYEPGASRVVASLGPSDVFIDVGANEGYFTILAAMSIGGAGRVHAFEPNPEARAILETSLERNGVRGRVEIHAAALTRTGDGNASLFLSDRGPSFSSLRPRQAPAAPDTFTRAIQVATTTMDQWAERAKVVPTLVKIDVEGAELLVLEGMSETLRRGACRIICETRADSDADRWLTDRGFRGEPLVADEGNRIYARPGRSEVAETAC